MLSPINKGWEQDGKDRGSGDKGTGSRKAEYENGKFCNPLRPLLPTSQQKGRHKDIIQPFSDQILAPCSVSLFPVNIAYLTNQCYGVNFKIPAKRLSCEIQCVCYSFLSGKRSVVSVSCSLSQILLLNYKHTLIRLTGVDKTVPFEYHDSARQTLSVFQDYDCGKI